MTDNITVLLLKQLAHPELVQHPFSFFYHIFLIQTQLPLPTPPQDPFIARRPNITPTAIIVMTNNINAKVAKK